MKRFSLVLVLLVALCGLTLLQSRQMEERPVLVKLGPPPDVQSVGLFAGDQKPFLAWKWVSKVMFYFGSLFESDARRVRVPPEYFNMFRTMEAAIHLDPYNMDAYYFSQAAFTWEIGRAREVNFLLLYGMNYRDWDYQLPFYAGFNAAYFLHDFAEGGRLMKIAAERSGNPLLTKLASRFFYQAKQTELGLTFLDTVIKQTRDPKLRQIYQTRFEALQATHEIENAVHRYYAKKGMFPLTLSSLVIEGYLASIPSDPYGGVFYITSDGQVESTSKFVFKSDEGKSNERQPNG